MRVRTFALCSILMLMPILNVHGQEADTRQRARSYEPLIASAAQRYNVDPHLLWTIAYLESRFRQEAISYKDGKPCAYGMMQFIGPTAARYGLKDPHNVREAIDAAARYVRDLQERFGARGDLILAAYNAGEGTVEAFRDGKRLVLPNRKVINPRRLNTGGVPPYLETREYVARGKIVYQNVSRAGFFPARVGTSVEGSANENPVSQPTSEIAPSWGSIYSSESVEKQSTHQMVKPTESKDTALARSIYVN